ncbi:uncharacterized protein LOC115232168 [Octopus sinensis]|uniref:Uncharacterized protein LOC115232168 n=1 Tax=Octopus sinensis TaxID=2607531 RepID=A0A7E6EMI0_9MOLL|nr:uncharacterized protein LOC115232168 [Octopus sinensis]
MIVSIIFSVFNSVLLSFSCFLFQNFIRAQDKALLSQLQQCQDNIEWLKSQRQQAAEQHELQSLTDDDSYWEDWEISEFEREEKLGLQSFNSKRFAYSNPELNQSLLATYTAKNTTLKNDIEIQLQPPE